MKNSLLYWSVISTFGFLFSSADLTSTGSPKRSIKHYRPSTISLDYSRKNPQNSNHENPDRENEDHPVRLFGFRRIGTVFPATLSKTGSGSGHHLPDKFLTMPHKKQVKQKQKQKHKNILKMKPVLNLKTVFVLVITLYFLDNSESNFCAHKDLASSSRGTYFTLA